MIGSVALMFGRCLDLPDEAGDVWAALFSVFESGYVTRDLATIQPADKILSTSAFGDMVINHILS